MYTIGKKYFFNNYWWVCTMTNPTYAGFERADKEGLFITKRIS